MLASKAARLFGTDWVRSARLTQVYHESRPFIQLEPELLALAMRCNQGTPLHCHLQIAWLDALNDLCRRAVYTWMAGNQQAGLPRSSSHLCPLHGL